MAFGVLGDLNWLAVIVATLAYYGLAVPWFSAAVFGKAWTRATDWKLPAGQRLGPEFYVGPLVTCLVSTVALAMLAKASGTNTVAEGITLGLVAGLGISGAVLFVTGYLDPKKPRPMLWVAIAAGYHLVGMVIAAVILAVWT
jgi:hypothetical protein